MRGAPQRGATAEKSPSASNEKGPAPEVATRCGPPFARLGWSSVSAEPWRDRADSKPLDVLATPR